MSICNARKKTNPLDRCSFKTIKNSKYCKKHSNDINIKDFNVPLYNNIIINNAITNFTKTNYNLNIMKYCLYEYNMIYNGVKNVIFYNFNRLQYYFKHINKIILIQKIFRGKLIRNINKFKGIYNIIYNKNLIVNTTDFYTCEDICNIDYNYIFSYKDIEINNNNENHFVYIFDIRSINLLIQNDNKNPYNRNIICDDIINNITYLNNYLTKKNINLLFEKDILTEEQQFRQKIIKIFQQIDSLEYYTDINWFINLAVYNLKHFYNILEDIWNWRAQLTIETKFNIIGNNTIFNNINIIKNSYNKKYIQDIILNDIEILVSNGTTNDFKKLGSLYILIALSNVSTECYNSMPWLHNII